MSKTGLNLQESEAVVVQTAGIVYAAFMQNGQASRENETELIGRSVKIAIEIAKQVDEKVRSDQEMS